MIVQSLSQVVNAPLYPVIATAWLRVRISAGLYKTIRVICDSGAQANLLADATAKELGVGRLPLKANIIGIGEAAVSTRGRIELELYHRIEDRQLVTSQFVIVDSR